MNKMCYICKAKTESGEVSFPFGYQIQSFNLILIFQTLKKIEVSIGLSVFRFSLSVVSGLNLSTLQRYEFILNYANKIKINSHFFLILFAKKFAWRKESCTFAVSKYIKRYETAGRRVSLFCARTLTEINTTAPCRVSGNRLGVLLDRLRQHVAQFFLSKNIKYATNNYPFARGRQPHKNKPILASFARIGKNLESSVLSTSFFSWKEISATLTLPSFQESTLQPALPGRSVSLGGAALRSRHAALYYYNRYSR